MMKPRLSSLRGIAAMPAGMSSEKVVEASRGQAPGQEAPLTAQSLLAMVIEDMEICWGERGSEYAFQDLSTETVDAIVAHIGGRRVE